MKKFFTRVPNVLSFRPFSSYRRNLIAFLLLTSLPGLVFGTVLFIVSKYQMEEELQEVHENHLYNTVGSIKKQFSNIELVLASWASNSFSYNYENLDIAQDYSKVRELYHTLVAMEESNSLIGRVELYLSGPEEVVFTKNGYTFLEETSQRETYKEALTKDNSLFWDHSLTSIEKSYGDKFASLGLAHNLPSGSLNPYGSLIVLLNKNALNDLIKSPYEEGSVFLLRNKNKWVFDNETQTGPTGLQKAVMEKISETPDSSERPFLFQWEGMKYTVTYSGFSRLGETWYYVSMAPLTTITAPVVFISKLFIVLSLVLLTLATLLSVFVSRKLYAPIESLIQKVSGEEATRRKNEFELIEDQWETLYVKSEKLQTRLEKQMTHLREGFLLQLIQGYLHSYQESDLKDRMQHYGWKSGDRKYASLYVQMFGFSRLEGKFLEGDEGLVTFLAANITEELTRDIDMEIDVINFHDLSIGILISYPHDKDQENVDAEIRMLCEDIITHINETCHMDVLVGVSKKTDSVTLIPEVFEETKQSLRLRNLQDKNQVIELDNIHQLAACGQGFQYPFDLEREITQAIRLKNKEEAVKLSESFFSVLSRENVSEAMMKQGSLQLLSSVFHIVLQSDLMEEFGNEGIHLHEELRELKEPEEISRWFERKVISPIIEVLSEKQDQHLRLVVEKVVNLIQEEYMTDISLDYCAEQVKLNPTILSKVFKEFSGWNFIDYLTNIRLTKAKELLIETDEKIKNIAESIGYKHSYFNRLFKKHEGLTPSEFREVTRKKAI